MGLFGDLDIEAASDNPFEIPADKYGCAVTKVEKKRNNDDTADFLVFTYTIEEGAADSAIGQDVAEWKKIPASNDEEGAERAKSFIKQRLLSLGVPENRVNTVNPDDLLGVKVWATIKPGKNGYPSVSKVELQDASSSSVSLGI